VNLVELVQMLLAGLALLAAGWKAGLALVAGALAGLAVAARLAQER
jgi:hypothetical protein